MKAVDPVRPCGCPGKPFARHETPEERADRGLPPCEQRGRKAISSGTPRALRPRGAYSEGNPAVRLPAELGDVAARCAKAGLVTEAVAALEGVLRKSTTGV